MAHEPLQKLAQLMSNFRGIILQAGKSYRHKAEGKEKCHKQKVFPSRMNADSLQTRETIIEGELAELRVKHSKGTESQLAKPS